MWGDPIPRTPGLTFRRFGSRELKMSAQHSLRAVVRMAVLAVLTVFALSVAPGAAPASTVTVKVAVAKITATTVKVTYTVSGGTAPHYCEVGVLGLQNGALIYDRSTEETTYLGTRSVYFTDLRGEFEPTSPPSSITVTYVATVTCAHFHLPDTTAHEASAGKIFTLTFK